MGPFVLVLIAALALPSAAAERYNISDARAEGPGSPRLIVLRDEVAGIEAAIAPTQGGELSGFRVRHGGEWIETLYLARDYTPRDGWTGKAPLLWPATGRNVPDRGEGRQGGNPLGYFWKDLRYPIPAHGFARDMPWAEVSRAAGDSGAGVTLVLTDSPATRRYYPFGFRLEAAYRLTRGRLKIAYTVGAAAENIEKMFFSIGNHITFRTPLAPGSAVREMLFESPSTVEYAKNGKSVPTGERRPLSYAEPVSLTEIPPRTAVSLGGYEGPVFMRLHDPQGLSIAITQKASSVPEEPVIRFNVWGDPEAGYFSPEPWVGLQNSLVLQQGLVRLSPGTDWSWELEISAEPAPSTR